MNCGGIGAASKYASDLLVHLTVTLIHHIDQRRRLVGRVDPS